MTELKTLLLPNRGDNEQRVCRMMLERIVEIAKCDPDLDLFLNSTYEYAGMYAAARQRQKGCDGMGELAMAAEEFTESVEKLLAYCRAKGYLDREINYSIESAADAFREISVRERGFT